MDKIDKVILDTNEYGKYAILCIFVSTVIQAFFGFARDASPFWKLIIASLCWLGVFLSIKKVNTLNRIPATAKITLVVMMLLIIIALFKSLFYGRVYSGEKLIVVFTNMFAVLDLVGIFFIMSVTNFNDLKTLMKVTKWMIPISLIVLFIKYQVAVESYFLTYIAIYSTIFFHYVTKRTRCFLIIGYLLALLAFFGGGRQAVLILVFTFLSVLLPLFLNKRWTYYISLIIFTCPIFLLYYSVNNESVFQMLSESYSSADSVDTRTFLWVELFDDFLRQPFITQLFGKGVLGYYESDFFGTMHRFGIEVPVLQWMMQTGYVYVILFTIIVAIAIYRLYIYGNNRMAQCASILIAGYYLNCYVSNLVGCNISHLGFWMLIGLALNGNIIRYKDVDLKKVLEY